MPLEITRCLRVPRAELAPPPPPVRRGPAHVVAVDTPWPNGQACHSCGRRRLVSAAPGAAAGATLGTSSRPGLGASVRLARLAALATARRGRGLPLLPVTLAGLPLFPSEM
jgi:hypothetical protein